MLKRAFLALMFIVLNQVALTAVKAAQFKPYMEDGVAVSAMADIPFEFLR